jgi:hypothetical protein
VPCDGKHKCAIAGTATRIDRPKVHEKSKPREGQQFLLPQASLNNE